jgi:long-chain acyl-CoA synthetase
MTIRAADTLPLLLLSQVAEHGVGTAYHDRFKGLWRGHSWRAAADRTTRLATALSRHGIRNGDAIAIIGNRPEWLWAAIAAQWIGAIVLVAAPELPGAVLADAFSKHQVRAAFVDGDHETRLVASLRDSLADLALVISVQADGPRRPCEPWLSSYRELIGAIGSATPPPVVAAPQDIAFITISHDKAAVSQTVSVSHATAIERARRVALLAKPTRADRVFAALPLSWPHGLIHHQVLSLLSGFPLIYPGGSTVLRDLRDAAPTLLFGPPLFYQRLRDEIAERIIDARVRSRLAIGSEAAPPSLFGRLLWRNPLNDRAGLNRVRMAVSFDGEPPPDVARFFGALGIAIRDFGDVDDPVAETPRQSASAAPELAVAHQAA